MLAPVHRSMNELNHRESERDEWWRPRAKAIADFCATNFESSDIVLLQEWWFQEEFSNIFDRATGHLFDRVAERRPGGFGGMPMRHDGMAVLVKKTGKLELLESQRVLTGPQRIAQLVHCRERAKSGRSVAIANAHLSFPSSPDPTVNDRRQAYEIMHVLRALEKTKFRNDSPSSTTRLEVIGGDFNSDSLGLAASKLETRPPGFVNCASAWAQQALSSTGGKVNLGVTHCTHRGEYVSVDHIFARAVSPTSKDCSSALCLGYLDAQGTRVTDCRRGELNLNGRGVISDHRPVTATLEWPEDKKGKKLSPVIGDVKQRAMASLPLDPLEPPSYMGRSYNSSDVLTWP